MKELTTDSTRVLDVVIHAVAIEQLSEATIINVRLLATLIENTLHTYNIDLIVALR